MDETIVHRLIDRITIGAAHMEDGEKVQRVKIAYNFVGTLKDKAVCLMSILIPNPLHNAIQSDSNKSLACYSLKSGSRQGFFDTKYVWKGSKIRCFATTPSKLSELFT
ncbi:MAG: DUF4368 domain-containing protein [Erysipelotrichia bacterium]|nr:DUF4368 domain-containing protein [Erysipelotrichia bacterium]